MINSKVLRLMWILSISGAISSSLTAIALSEASPNQLASQSTSVPASPSKLVSDGNMMDLSRARLKIAPPAGWEVLTGSSTMSAVFQEQAPEKVVYNQPMYQRNITVVAIQKPSPIDEQRAAEFKDELTAKFSKEGTVKDFQVIETKFFDYRGKNDGIVAFSTFRTGEFSMMQMHVLISGDKNQAIMTYTDLQDRFNNPETYQIAWKTIQSAQIEGMTPSRFDGYMPVGGGVAAILVALMLVSALRRRRQNAAMLVAGDDETWAEFDDDRSSFSKKENHASKSNDYAFDFPVSNVSNF